ncbi:MAG: hypothetical protein ACD_3C00208G0004 [uncultured bacterium (gcode 4)]|uniref:Uncharacterized protein n=1 Tax=uncultured bacterium (gcode 4) TaxID=1234023 RepID=K2FZT9_9BACT|nr:MAG: hypothetical protein ACD_3C00208G0004 [uncultured bacterium (gcode 4)]
MYKNPFYIEEAVWNNSFWQPLRNWRSLFVPSIIKWSMLDLKIWDNIAFEEVDNNEITSFRWLKNFIETSFAWIPLYIFDNHNHAFYFWNLAKNKQIIKKNITLVHIDEHSDMREPDLYMHEYDLNDLNKVFEYTNNVLNVGNYIKPALKIWLIDNLNNIQSEWELDDIYSKILDLSWDMILNLDLDFFSEEMEYISYTKKKKIILGLAHKSKLITISTSPFFIDQNKAIEICKDIFLR